MDEPSMEVNWVEIEHQLELLCAGRKWRTIRKRFSGMLQTASAPVIVRWNVGWAHLKVGDFAAAAKLFAECTELDPSSATGWWALGLAQQRTVDDSKAELYFLRSIALKDCSMARQTLAVQYMMKNQWESAAIVLWEGLRLFPKSRNMIAAFQAFLEDAEGPIVARKFRAAARKLLPIFQRGAIDADALYNGLALAIASAGGLSLIPPRLPLSQSREIALFHEQKWAELIDLAESSPQESNIDPAVCWRVAYAYLSTEQWEKAAEVAQRCLQLDPNSAGALYVLGCATLKKHNHSSAELLLLRSLAFGDTPITRFALAECDLRLGRQRISTAIIAEGTRLFEGGKLYR